MYVPPQLLHHRSKIPAAMQDGLRRVCAVKVPNYAEVDVKATFDDPLTFQDLGESLDSRGAPGPSDATVNMANAWSPETRRLVYDMANAWSPETRRLVYDQMSNIWVYRSTPKWLKNSFSWHRRLLATRS
jgi:hypothetical protein